MWKSSLDKKFKVLIQRICTVCRITSFLHLIFSAVCDTIIFVSRKNPVTVWSCWRCAYPLPLWLLSVLFSFSAHLLCFHGRSCLAGEWQPPPRCLLRPLCCSGGCSLLFSSCFHNLVGSCLQESKGKPEGYWLRRWFPSAWWLCSVTLRSQESVRSYWYTEMNSRLL